jgi:hypothetical protein
VNISKRARAWAREFGPVVPENFFNAGSEDSGYLVSIIVRFVSLSTGGYLDLYSIRQTCVVGWGHRHCTTFFEHASYSFISI